MAELKSSAGINFKINMVMNEPESRALEAITKYGVDNFLNRFYEELVVSYLKPYEEGLLSLFSTIVQEIPGHLDKIDKARKVFIA